MSNWKEPIWNKILECRKNNTFSFRISSDFCGTDRVLHVVGTIMEKIHRTLLFSYFPWNWMSQSSRDSRGKYFRNAVIGPYQFGALYPNKPKSGPTHITGVCRPLCRNRRLLHLDINNPLPLRVFHLENVCGKWPLSMCFPVVLQSAYNTKRADLFGAPPRCFLATTGTVTPGAPGCPQLSSAGSPTAMILRQEQHLFLRFSFVASHVGMPDSSGSDRRRKH